MEQNVTIRLFKMESQNLELVARKQSQNQFSLECFLNIYFADLNILRNRGQA